MIVARYGAQAFDRADLASFAALLWAGGGRKVIDQICGKWIVAQARRPDDPARNLFESARSGRIALLNGQIHNSAELARALGLDAGLDPAVLYAEAIDRWGDQADQRVIGHYCAISFFRSDPVVRVARSPFVAPPLHVRDADGALTVSSTTRCLFWRDEAAKKLDLDRVGRTLINDFSDPFRGPYHGAVRIPMGRVLLFSPGQIREVWRYDIHANPIVKLKTDDEYVEAANALLDEGTSRVMAGAKRPGIALSGGLDSTLLALNMLKHLPEGERLDAFTFGPESTWAGADYPGTYSREFGRVAALVERYPQIRPHQITSDGRDFRYQQRDMLRALDQGPGGLGFSMAYKGVYEAAAQRGCDVIVNATWGNYSFSAYPSWAGAELFRTGQLRELWQLMRNNPGDDRPMWRRFIALAVMPHLPYPLWRLIERMRRHGAPDYGARWGVSPEWLDNGAQLARARAAGCELERMTTVSRREHWDSLLLEDGTDAEEIQQALLQLDGVETRDASAYRPLVEFGYGVPTRQFIRNGTRRWLARRMGEGRIPDEIRLNPARGWPGVDWHQRIGRIRHELIEEIDRMSEVPEIISVVDLPRLRQALVDFPEEAPDGMFDNLTLQQGVATGISAGRFIAYTQGRNDI